MMVIPLSGHYRAHKPHLISYSNAQSHILFFQMLRGQRNKHPLKIAQNDFFPFYSHPDMQYVRGDTYIHTLPPFHTISLLIYMPYLKLNKTVVLIKPSNLDVILQKANEYDVSTKIWIKKTATVEPIWHQLLGISEKNSQSGTYWTLPDVCYWYYTPGTYVWSARHSNRDVNQNSGSLWKIPTILRGIQSERFFLLNSHSQREA